MKMTFDIEVPKWIKDALESMGYMIGEEKQEFAKKLSSLGKHKYYESTIFLYCDSCERNEFKIGIYAGAVHIGDLCFCCGKIEGMMIACGYRKASYSLKEIDEERRWYKNQKRK